MANIVQVECQNLVNAWLGISAYTAAAAPMKLRLFTSATSSTAVGTEVPTAQGYSSAGQTIAFTAPAAATPSTTANTATVSFTNMPACTVTDINIFDSTGTPVRRAFGALTASKTVGSGDTLSFAAAAITASIG